MKKKRKGGLNMNSIVKKLYVGRCYVCGKPIREDDMYGTMEDSDTLYCEACWNEYAERCDAIIEQMKKEKGQAVGCIFGNTPSENNCRFCGVSCGVRAPGANGVSSTELVPSGETVGLSIMAYLDKNVKHDNGNVCGVRLKVAREWLRDKINPKQELSGADLEKELNQWRHDHFKGKRDYDYSGEYIEREGQLDLARNFYELGFKTRKKAQPEVDLENYLENYFWGWRIGEGIGLTKPDGLSCIVDDLKRVARHFYELGLNARKEDKK